MPQDIAIYESGNGGDIAIVNQDIARGDVLLQQAYLAMFGGNVEAITKGNEPATEARGDYWGNSLFWSNTKDRQFNSQTEQALRDNPFNSNGRVKVIRAVQADLSYLNSYATITVDATIVSQNNIKISIQMIRPGQPNLSLQVIWDSAMSQALIFKKI